MTHRVPSGRQGLPQSVTKGVRRFNVHGKLRARFTRPYYVIENISKVAYRLALPSELASVYVFHTSQLRKYMPNPTCLLNLVGTLLTKSSQWRSLMEAREKLHNKVIPLVKVLSDS